jgi:hypothetical protein
VVCVSWSWRGVSARPEVGAAAVQKFGQGCLTVATAEKGRGDLCSAVATLEKPAVPTPTRARKKWKNRDSDAGLMEES